MESMEQLAEERIAVKFHQIRTIWPVLEDDLREFLDGTDKVFVVENNYSGQLAGLIGKTFPEYSERIESITKFDGSSFKPKEITGAVLAAVRSQVSA
jgi:2-oxoglutarate/2-oxoacid ferredoxin oxidoreductase subunit alpha